MRNAEERIRNGFLTVGPTSDRSFARTRDSARFRDEEEEPDDEVVVHNHIPLDFGREHDPTEEDGEESEYNAEVVARFPQEGHNAVTEGDELVVYRGCPWKKSDRFEMDSSSARDSGPRPPRTLTELNRYHAAHYSRRPR